MLPRLAASMPIAAPPAAFLVRLAGAWSLAARAVMPVVIAIDGAAGHEHVAMHASAGGVER